MNIVDSRSGQTSQYKLMDMADGGSIITGQVDNLSKTRRPVMCGVFCLSVC